MMKPRLDEDPIDVEDTSIIVLSEVMEETSTQKEAELFDK
jgi:hypothetical protein